MPAMDAYRTLWPEVELDIISGFVVNPLPLLDQGEAELAIIHDRQEAHPTVTFSPLFRYESVALMSPRHRLAAKPWLDAADFAAEGVDMAIRLSKGKIRHVVLTDEGKQSFTEWTENLGPADHVFLRADNNRWGASHQKRPLDEASERAGIEPAVTFHILRHTHGSHLAMAGVPMGVIAAQLGHADTRMTEKHYAHLAPSYVAQTIRANFPVLNLAEESQVVPLRRRIAN